jgi:hypothetical protein
MMTKTRYMMLFTIDTSVKLESLCDYYSDNSSLSPNISAK